MHCASTNSKCIEHSYTYRFPVCVKILGVPSTASSVTTASSSTLPSSSLVPFRLHFVFTTVTSSGTISTPLHRLSDEVCDFALKSSPLRELECVMSYASPMPSSGESREPYEAEAGS